MPQTRRRLILRGLEAALLVDLGLFVWALLGRGLFLAVNGKRLIRVTEIVGPLWFFWILLALRIAAGIRWARPERPLGAGGRWAVRLALPFLLVFLVFSIGEGIARVFRSRDREIGEKLQKDLKADAGPLRPNSDVVVEGSPVQTNSEGFRGSSFPVSPPPKQFRILAVGDSFTFGNKVGQGDPWPVQLQDVLCAETGSDVLVINGGIWGLNTTQEVANVEKWVPRYRPDVVILAYVPNDVVWEEVVQPADYNLYDKSHLYRFVREQVLQIRYLVGSRKYWAFDDSNPGWRASREALADFARLASENGFRPLVATFPYMETWDDEDRRDRETLAAAIDAIGLPRLDLFPAYERHGNPLGLQVEPTDTHPNREGYAVAAREIADRLYADGVLTPTRRE